MEKRCWSYRKGRKEKTKSKKKTGENGIGKKRV